MGYFRNRRIFNQPFKRIKPGVPQLNHSKELNNSDKSTSGNDRENLPLKILKVIVNIAVFAAVCILTLLYFPQFDKVCYYRVGCFTVSKPWSERPNIFNFFPQSPNAINTTFILSSRRHPQGLGIRSKNPNLLPLLINFPWGTSNNVVFIIHGFTDDTTTWMQDLKNAYLNLQDTSVILVDWSHGAGGYYPQVVSNTRVVAKEIFKFLIRIEKFWTGKKRVHLVGHSLGSQISSYVGKLSKLKPIFQITALDPAFPLFEGFSTDIRLNRRDANNVVVIHSNIGPWGLGMKDPVGDVDIYLNNGRDQRGCTPMKNMLKVSFLKGGWENLANFKDNIACSHRRAYEVLDDILRNAYKSSMGILAYPMNSPEPEMKSVHEYSFCRRKKNACWKLAWKEDTFFNIPKSSPDSPTLYYIPTSGEKPYCVRMAYMEIKTCPIPIWSKDSGIQMTYDGFGEQMLIFQGSPESRQEISSWVELSCTSLYEEIFFTVRLTVTGTATNKTDVSRTPESICFSTISLTYYSVSKRKIEWLLPARKGKVTIPYDSCYNATFNLSKL